MLTNQMYNAIKSLWTDKVTIVGTKANNDDSPFDDVVDDVIVENEPGKVITRSIKSVNQQNYGSENYDALLLIRNGIKIPAGCEIYVTDLNGNQTHYQYSSDGYTGYYSHQEVSMTLDRKA